MAKRNSYWINRMASLEAAVYDYSSEVIYRIIKHYKNAVHKLDEDIKRIFNEFQGYRELSEEKAKELISAAEQRKTAAELRELYESVGSDFEKNEILDKINALAYGRRINRIEAVKYRIYTALKTAAELHTRDEKSLHERTYKESYYTNIYELAKGYNMGIDFSIIPKHAVEAVLKEPWKGKNYSQRIWDNSDGFIEKLENVITEGIITGRSIDRMANEFREYIDNDMRYEVERLVRSETSHFMSQGQLAAYREAGVSKYKYVCALSEKTCKKCQGLDGKVYLRDEAKPGINYPPMHPFCRCLTITAGLDIKTRNARDPLTGKNYKVDGNMTFAEWEKSLSDEQREAMNTHVRMMRNKSADKRQYEKYKQIYGKDFPKTIEEFIDIKYNDNEKWELFKSEKQNRLNKMDFKNMSGLIGKLGNKEVRIWYKTHDENIPNLIDTTRSLEEQAKQACELRNNNRTNARDLMRNQELRRQLDKTDPNLSFEELISNKMKRKSITREEAVKDIIKTATKTNTQVNRKFGLE